MAQPKYKLSRSRTRKRRSHQGLKAPNVVKCGNCGGATLSHRVCPSCGMYKGRQVFKFDFEEDDDE